MEYDGSTSSIKYGPVDRPALEDLQAEFALRRASPQIWLPMSEMVNLASATCAYRKVRFERTGDEARRPGHAIRCGQSSEPGVRPANLCSMSGAFSPCCTTRQHNAHRTEEREVLYRWHPWCGRRVFVHDVSFKGGVRIFRCAETAQVARCVEVPEGRRKWPSRAPCSRLQAAL